MNDYLKSTKMLNYDAREIVELIAARKWASLNDTYDKIGEIYDYVQNAVPLGYNKYDSLTASQVLADGFGQCNTKATLITSLLRAVGVPCRLHGSKVTKEFQRGLMPKLMAKLAPPLILHTWAEVLYDDEWLSLEGVITDKIYLSGLRALFPEQRGRFFDYAVAVDDFSELKVDWRGKATAIQQAAVVEDLGVFDSPDAVYARYSQEYRGGKKFMYENIGRGIMNKRVSDVRKRATERCGN